MPSCGLNLSLQSCRLPDLPLYIVERQHGISAGKRFEIPAFFCATAKWYCDPEPGPANPGPGTSEAQYLFRFVSRSAVQREFRIGIPPEDILLGQLGQWVGGRIFGCTDAAFPRIQRTGQALFSNFLKKWSCGMRSSMVTMWILSCILATLSCFFLLYHMR